MSSSLRHRVEEPHVEPRERGGVAGRPAAALEQLGWRHVPRQVLLERVGGGEAAQLAQQGVLRREQSVRPASCMSRPSTACFFRQSLQAYM